MPTELRVLSFDIENRPLSYLSQDFTTADITAIAWGTTPADVECEVQTKSDRSRVRMLKAFVRAYDEADIVTGHYILKHDLPHINGALMEAGLPRLGPKMVSDTKTHLRKFTGISKSQENLGEMFQLLEQKVAMNTPKWREANRLTTLGVALTRERCIGDVIMHMELRAKLIELGWLGPPRRWSS
jgi:hypothetical protein